MMQLSLRTLGGNTSGDSGGSALNTSGFGSTR
jgi:hypothetical protein